MTTAIYHGSLWRFHGLITVLGECACEVCSACRGRTDDIRWSLVTGDGEQLDHVRPESFTRAAEPEAVQRLAEVILLVNTVADDETCTVAPWHLAAWADAEPSAREECLTDARLTLSTVLED